MSTIDVLDASNWYTVECSLVEFSSESVGWTGSSWFSEGRIAFDFSTSSYGYKITSISFDCENVENPALGGGSVIPYINVMDNAYHVLYEGYATGSSITLADYDENEYDLGSITFSSVEGWDSYEYMTGGGTGDSRYYMTLSSLLLVYGVIIEPVVPIWQSYVNTYEVVTV